MPWPRMRWRHHFSNSIRSSVLFWRTNTGTSILKDEVSFGISCFLYPMLSQVIRFYQIESHNSHNICLSWIFGLSLAHLLPIDFEQKKRPFQHSWGRNKFCTSLPSKVSPKTSRRFSTVDGPRVVHVEATEGHLRISGCPFRFTCWFLFYKGELLRWCFSPNSVVTLGVLTVIVKAGVWRTGVGRISSLFSWFRACMFVSCVNFHSLRVAQTGVNGFCL